MRLVWLSAEWSRVLAQPNSLCSGVVWVLITDCSRKSRSRFPSIVPINIHTKQTTWSPRNMRSRLQLQKITLKECHFRNFKIYGRIKNRSSSGEETGVRGEHIMGGGGGGGVTSLHRQYALFVIVSPPTQFLFRPTTRTWFSKDSIRTSHSNTWLKCCIPAQKDTQQTTEIA